MAGPDPGRCNRCKCIGQQKKLPMHSSVRFLPQIMRPNTFCENTRLIMHKFQQSYFFFEMSKKHIPKLTSERLILFSQKYALALLC